ncbi:hypothetical protein K435DRAFT_569130, partial [Dendrothele bispora CBS 962.96]
VIGDDWVDAVDTLVSLEAAYGFKQNMKSLPTTKRPPAVEHWVGRGRVQTVPGPLHSVTPKDFEKELKIWWNELMPVWRKVGTEELEGCEWKKKAEGDWCLLKMPGNNGLYSILACMRWWLLMEEHQTAKASSAWKQMLEEVVWVIDSLASSADSENPAKK